MSESKIESSSDSSQKQDFALLYSKHARGIYTYILAQLPNWTDADEVFQETSIILWKKLSEYEPGTNFIAWAQRVAHFEVLRFRKRSGRRPAATFGDEFIELVDREMAVRAARVDVRSAALEDCLGQLPDRDQLMVRQYYHVGSSAKQIAEQVGRGVDAVYKALQRIHRALLECVNSKVEEDRP